MGESFQCNMLDQTTYLTIPSRIDLKDPSLIGMGIVFNIIMSDQDQDSRIILKAGQRRNMLLM